MPEIPESFSIGCEGCKKVQSPSAINGKAGLCPACGHDQWHVHVDFQSKSKGESVTRAVGLDMLMRVGFNIDTADSDDPSSRDFHFVPASEIVELCRVHPDPLVLVAAYVARKESQLFNKHKAQMEERGGKNCEACNMLFVPSADKPWTLVGVCSKACCADKYKASDYSQIEKDVLSTAAQLRSSVEEKSVSDQVAVSCDCGNTFNLNRMYCGLFRKCPACGKKVFVAEG